MSRKRCGRPVLAGPTPHGVVDGINIDGCAYPRTPGKQRCVWHWLLSQPADVQQRLAAQRQVAADIEANGFRPRVPAAEWPDGERWCAGCQSFVPMFYTTGSRCKSCASTAAHAQAIERQYGLTGPEYDELFRYQGGRCAICRRRPGKKRLAVDHDHRSGEVRGLLCANNENGCNRGVVANLEAAEDGGLAAARRAVAYLELSPWDRLRGRSGDEERIVGALRQASRPEPQKPPF